MFTKKHYTYKLWNLYW